MENPASQEPPNTPVTKYCTSCGKQLRLETKFCGYCGKGQLPTSKSDASGRVAANVSTRMNKDKSTTNPLLVIGVILVLIYLLVQVLSFLAGYLMIDGQFNLGLWCVICLAAMYLWRHWKKT